MGRHRHDKLTRREFVGRTCLAAAGASLGGLAAFETSCSAGDRGGSPAKKKRGAKAAGADALGAKVVSRADGKVFGKGGHDPGRVARIVQRSVADLVGVKDYREAFRALFTPQDVVAIKPNCLAGPGMSTSVAVVDALVGGLRAIGVPHDKIIIWERTSDELAKTGFTLNRYTSSRPLCLGNDEAGFHREIQFSGEVGSLFSNVLARRATALINVPVLKDHDLSGVGCGMKNMYGAIHNPNRYHDNNCDPFVADVSAHPLVRDKLKLVLCDALTAQYHGGPARVVEHQWRPGMVLAATDPVAMDRVAQKLIEDERAKHGMGSFVESKRPPKWLATASKKYKLGESELGRIVFDRG